ncbi:MAG: DUF454 domain-containing protein [Ignavibacteria bacterium]
MKETITPSARSFKPLSTPLRIVLIIAGTISLALGIVGAFVPILPTTPFVLLAAMCYVRSSQRLYARLMRSRLASKHVQSVLAGHGIPLSVKSLSLVFSAIMIGYVSVFVTESFLIRMLLGVLYLVQLVFMVKIKTARHGPRAHVSDTVASARPAQSGE